VLVFTWNEKVDQFPLLTSQFMDGDSDFSPREHIL
jgi:hypothetical protein